MKTIVFQNTRFDVDRFFSKRLAVGLTVKSNRIMNNILTRGVIMYKKLNLIDKFVVTDPLSEIPALRKQLTVDQSVLDGMKTEITQMAPPHTLMKTMALFGGMDVDRVSFDTSVPLTISRAVWNVNDSEKHDSPGARQCNSQLSIGPNRYDDAASSRYTLPPVDTTSLTYNRPMVTGQDATEVSTSSGIERNITADMELNEIFEDTRRNLKNLEEKGLLGSIEGNQRRIQEFNDNMAEYERLQQTNKTK